MILNSGMPLYPVFLAGVDIVLAGVLLVVAPAVGAVMAVTAMLVVTALTLQVIEYISLRPKAGVLREV
jgi:hypothetical protein